ncbi:MAG: hypothetical protein K6G55_04560 [Selenomonadaceae bacterium]|nr:hypothetical protein [Selenomonadaceae bacterium]
MAENTYRTILFEEFDSDKPNLYGILSIAANPAGETVYYDVKNKLSVHSFDEFLERFAPKVYEKHEPSPDGKGLSITYSTENSLGAIPLDIVSNSYYKMLLNLYRSKEKSGESNLKFNYEELFDQLKPKQEVENAKTLRMQLNAAQEKYYECQDKGESTDEARKIFNGCFKKVREQYGKSVINLLPLAMADLDTKINAADKLLTQNAGRNEDEVLQIASGYKSFFKEDGTLDIAPIQIQSSTDTIEELPAKQIAGGERKLLSDIIENDYAKRVKSQNDFVRSLVVATYAPLTTADAASDSVEMSLAEVRKQQDINLVKKQSYERTFQNAKAAFIQAMTETVQKLLGMQALFDHATSKGELTDGLIIANCSVSLLMRECKESFARFINRVGHDSVGNRVWFAIVPGVSEGLSDDEDEDDDEDILGGDSVDSGSVKPNYTKSVNMNELRQFLPIMDDARIMTVFSFKSNDKNGFLMTPQYVEEKRDSLSNVKNKHAVYAYPNFTLTRPRNIKLFDEAERLAIPGVYIDAAYVAGGLLIGCQQPSYLEKHGLQVHHQLPCVRIDFENTTVRQKLVTKFNKESDFDVNEDLRNEINRDRLGFVFSGDEMGDIQNTYIYIANTLYKSPGSDVYRPIYATLVEDYMRAVYNRVQDKSRKGVKREFIDGIVAEWKRCADGKEHANDVNLLLHDNEDIHLEDNPETGNPELKIKLSALEAALDNLEIAVEQKS